MKRRNEHNGRHRKSNYNKTSRRENHNPSTYQPTRDYRNQRDNDRNDRNTERDQETAMMARYNGFMLIASKCEGIDSNTWIADTGASAHMTYNKSGFIEMKEDARQITIGDGSNMAIKQIGKWQGMITDKTGKQQLITLDEVCYVPELKYNLMSLTKALKNGWILSGNNQQLSLRKADEEMIFDKKIHSSNGHIFGIDIVSTKEHAMIVEDRKEVTIKQAHSY